MAEPAYRKASRSFGLWWLTVILGLGVQLATTKLFRATGAEQHFGPWSMGIAFVPLIVVLGVAWKVIGSLNRRRVHLNALMLGELGFETVEKPSESERVAFAAPLAHLLPTLGLKSAASGIQWFAVQTKSPALIRLFEHRYLTGSGKNTQEHLCTVIAWPKCHADMSDPRLPLAPWFYMKRYGWWERRALRAKEIHAPELADLAELWSCFGDALSGTQFLTPAVRQTLQESAKGEAWCIGAGFVACSFNGTFDAENLQRLFVYARRVLANKSSSPFVQRNQANRIR